LKKGIVVIGAGGHAKVCIELLRAMGEEVAVCIGEGAEKCAGVPVMRGDENLRRLRAEGHSRAFVAIGSNPLRERLGAAAVELGYELVNAVSPRSIVSPSARLGRGVAIMAGAVINAEAVIEDLAIINTGATVDHDCRIGRAAHIAPQCGLAGNVTVGERTLVGIGSVAIPGMSIGSDVTLGAGSAVAEPIPDGVVAVGVPARVLRKGS